MPQTEKAVNLKLNITKFSDTKTGSRLLQTAIVLFLLFVVFVPLIFTSATWAQPAPDSNRLIFIKGGRYTMGDAQGIGSNDERPAHQVTVPSFYMSETEVTNAQFKRFVEATGYITTAEKLFVLENGGRLDSIAPGALVFQTCDETKPIRNLDWWKWISGANWRQPQGEGSSIEGKENHPVVHVSWYDAQAFCQWLGVRLPTEAEWEYAARGGLKNATFPWGNEPVAVGKPKANIWQGAFPVKNTTTDGYERTAPVKTYAPNGYGLYDMSGNVWEWCSDNYHSEYYQQKVAHNPTGPAQSYDPMDPSPELKVIRGGSFLCHASYCSGYRVSRRMKSSPDTGLEHTGFRYVQDVR